MATNEPGMCDVCGQRSMFDVHVHDAGTSETVMKSYCLEHAPAEFRDRMLDAMPFGPHRTPAEESAFLPQQLTAIESPRSSKSSQTSRLAADGWAMQNN
jgi:hypothetical protein